ncbi:hypothetical protein [Nocardioides sp. InS609-2]|uniref:hypothetical protein n=1 Tax=Nocardioides sp. InS609-2 TaxID=2760705 RepID=UPI0020C0DB26|nr:hypothetical protein [Nocardioides sp. InS609-2]
MKDVYLHVGPVKTGSTYLQDLLWRNRDDLARQGYHHPGEHPNEMWLATTDMQDHAFIHFEIPESEGVWDKVCERVARHDGPSVISHEVLGWSTADHVAKVVHSLAPARLHVVVMARSLATILSSLWQEKIKMVYPDTSLSDFVVAECETRSPWTDASLIVDRWLAHVPPTRIHVVTVPPRGAEPTVLLGRFARALGIETTSWHTGGAARNQSLDRVQAELLRRLNVTSSSTQHVRAQRRLINGSLLPRLRAADPRREIRLPASGRGWIETETSRRIEALQRSGAHIHGDLADLRTPDGAWEDTPLRVLDQDVLDEALQLLVSSHPDLTPDRLDIV